MNQPWFGFYIVGSPPGQKKESKNPWVSLGKIVRPGIRARTPEPDTHYSAVIIQTL
jgi:hypothetical protein